MNMLRRWIAIAVMLALAAPSPAPAAPSAPDSGTTERVSLASDETPGDNASSRPSLSADGRLVAFDSLSTNLVPGDSNGTYDVFVRDRFNGTTERVSISAHENQANGESYSPSISTDGRFVAFVSLATNLAPSDANGAGDIFVRDRRDRTTERDSLASDETPGNGASANPSISADGLFVAYESLATNLVSNDINNTVDVFVRNRIDGTTERVSVSQNEFQGNAASSMPSISADGRFVAFTSSADNLVPGDTNGDADIFVRDRNSGSTSRVSLDDDEAQGNGYSHSPSISADGRFVAFLSAAFNLVAGDDNGEVDIFVRDRLNGTIELISIASDGTQANDYSFAPSISADGRFVAFETQAAFLVPGDTNSTMDVFVRDRLNATTERVSLTSDESQGDGHSDTAAISANGRFVAFRSLASNLTTPGDTNGFFDIFERDRYGNGFSIYLPLASTR